MKSLRSPLGNAVGFGSAKSGVHHWWMQRLTSIALVPLTVWFTVSILSLQSLDHATLVAWMAQSWTALLLIILVLVATYHSQLGVQVVVEDYVHNSGTKTLTLVIVTFGHALLAVAGVFAILKVAFGGVAFGGAA
jgi:succinate dehydrogenase / fumarate reductase membrane anchor subunit